MNETDISFLRFQVDSKKIYVMLNHRTAYLCWLDTYKKSCLKENTLLFHIGHRADFWLDNEKLIEGQKNLNINDLNQLNEFVKLKMDKKNTDFIVLSMYRGIIGDIISISRNNDEIYGEKIVENQAFNNRMDIGTRFKDRSGKVHKFLLGGHSIINLLGRHGVLKDAFVHQDLQKIFHENVQNDNVMLDISFDYFTYESDEGHRESMNDRHLERLFSSSAFNYIWSNVKLITVALEPEYCGGKEECKSILKQFNSFIVNRHNTNIEKKVTDQFQL